MLGKAKIMLSAAVLLAGATAAFAHVVHIAPAAHFGKFPAGPEWYVDDQGNWHSIRSDWANIQRPVGSPNRRSRRLRTPDTDER
jgi:hypothetical protein